MHKKFDPNFDRTPIRASWGFYGPVQAGQPVLAQVVEECSKMPQLFTTANLVRSRGHLVRTPS